MVEATVDHDAIDPGRELGLGSVATCGLHDGYEDRLGDVAGILRVTYKSVGNTMDELGVPLVENPKRLAMKFL